MENYLRYWTPVDFFCPRSEDGMCKFHSFIFGGTIKCRIPSKEFQIFKVPMSYGR